MFKKKENEIELIHELCLLLLIQPPIGQGWGSTQTYPVIGLKIWAGSLQRLGPQNENTKQDLEAQEVKQIFLS